MQEQLETNHGRLSVLQAQVLNLSATAHKSTLQVSFATICQSRVRFLVAQISDPVAHGAMGAAVKNVSN